MKNRIIKSGIIVAVVTLVMFNIQVLSDTTDNPFFQGSTVSAVEDPNQPGSGDIRYHYLDEVWCIITDFDVDLDYETKWWGPKITVSIDLTIDFNGSKWKCREIAQEVYCNPQLAKPCESSSVAE